MANALISHMKKFLVNVAIYFREKRVPFAVAGASLEEHICFLIRSKKVQSQHRTVILFPHIG